MSRHMFTAERVVWGGASEASDGGYIIVQDGVIVSCGTGDSVAKAASEEQRVSRHTGLLTAGLVDAHTHAVWAGSRATEYAMRMAGADYEKIAAAGGRRRAARPKGVKS